MRKRRQIKDMFMGKFVNTPLKEIDANLAYEVHVSAFSRITPDVIKWVYAALSSQIKKEEYEET